MSIFRSRLYGASPWHLAALLGSFAVTAYVLSRLWENPNLLRIALWFVGAAAVWDLVLSPLIALADRLLRPLWSHPRRLGLLNHVRVPALLSGLLFLVWAPLILQRSESIFRLKAGLDQDPYLDRWLTISVGLFAVSAAIYAVRLARSRPAPEQAQGG
jgi:hypothetical protein